jgi:thiamine biosynthesis lipoprotein
VTDTTRGSWWIDETLVDVEHSRVRTPAGVQLDAGAIGKGLAADLVSEFLHDAGAVGARVVIGGDLRVTVPTVVDVNDPGWHGPIERVAIEAGGVATSGISSTTTLPTPSSCPVLDPRTRGPLATTSAADVVQVTAAADSAAHAEVCATAVLVDPTVGRAMIGEAVALLVVHGDGSTVANDAWRSLRGAPMGPGER